MNETLVQASLDITTVDIIWLTIRVMLWYSQGNNDWHLERCGGVHKTGCQRWIRHSLSITTVRTVYPSLYIFHCSVQVSWNQRQLWKPSFNIGLVQPQQHLDKHNTQCIFAMKSYRSTFSCSTMHDFFTLTWVKGWCKYPWTLLQKTLFGWLYSCVGVHGNWQPRRWTDI